MDGGGVGGEGGGHSCLTGGSMTRISLRLMNTLKVANPLRVIYQKLVTGGSMVSKVHGHTMRLVNGVGGGAAPHCGEGGQNLTKT